MAPGGILQLSVQLTIVAVSASLHGLRIRQTWRSMGLPIWVPGLVGIMGWRNRKSPPIGGSKGRCPLWIMILLHWNAFLANLFMQLGIFEWWPGKREDGWRLLNSNRLNRPPWWLDTLARNAIVAFRLVRYSIHTCMLALTQRVEAVTAHASRVCTNVHFTN